VKVAILAFALCTPAFADVAAGQRALRNGDNATAFKEFLPAAKQGNALAQYDLGILYYNGQGARQDYKEAVRWFRLAAHQGSAPAQANLGTAYFLGRGTQQDYKEAVRWFLLAADQGDASGQFNLGVAYSQGRGVARDYIQAYMWLIIAGAGNDVGIAAKSISARDKVAVRMTSEQMAQARRLAGQWRPKKGISGSPTPYRTRGPQTASPATRSQPPSGAGPDTRGQMTGFTSGMTTAALRKSSGPGPLGLLLGIAMLVGASLWVRQDAIKRRMSRHWGMGVFWLCIVFLPLYLVARSRNPILTAKCAACGKDIVAPLSSCNDCEQGRPNRIFG
jgi:hypothetical protein